MRKKSLSRALTLGLAAIVSLPVLAELPTDFYIQSDSPVISMKQNEGIAEFYQEQIDWLLERKYPPASIILNSVARGMTVADAVYFMSRSQPVNAPDFLNLAQDLLPSLPGWACGSEGSVVGRYDKPLTLDDFDHTPTLAEVAELYFQEHKRFTNNADWESDEAQLNISIDELIEAKKKEMALAGQTEDGEVDSWWFLEGKEPKTHVHLVGLYPGEQRIVVENRLSELEKLKAQGVTIVPTTLVYNEIDQIPLSDIERVPEEPYGGSEMKDDEVDFIDYQDDEITASEIIARYTEEGKRITPPRDWQQGDYHLNVRVEELLTLFDVPEKDEIDPETWAALEERLKQGLDAPLLISLFDGSDQDRWIDQPELLRVAEEMGIVRLPTVFLYHDLPREPCGVPAFCVEQLQMACEAGSGSAEGCRPPDDELLSPEPEFITPRGNSPVSPH